MKCFSTLSCVSPCQRAHTSDDALRVFITGVEGKRFGCLEGRERRGDENAEKERKKEEERRHAINGGKGRGKVTNEKRNPEREYIYILREFSTTKRPQKNKNKRNKLFFGVMEEMLIISQGERAKKKDFRSFPCR